MTRLPAGVDPADDVLVAEVRSGVVYHRPVDEGASCGVSPAGLLPPVGAYRLVALSGSPCAACWPDPYGLAVLDSPHLSPAAVRDCKASGAASVRGPAWTHATTPL